MFLFKKNSLYMKMMAFENEFLLLCYVYDHFPKLRVVVVVGYDESFIFYFSYFLSLVPS